MRKIRSFRCSSYTEARYTRPASPSFFQLSTRDTGLKQEEDADRKGRWRYKGTWIPGTREPKGKEGRKWGKTRIPSSGLLICIPSLPMLFCPRKNHQFLSFVECGNLGNTLRLFFVWTGPEWCYRLVQCVELSISLGFCGSSVLQSRASFGQKKDRRLVLSMQLYFWKDTLKR